MPDPSVYETEDDWMSACIPKVLDDGSAKSQDQAIAMCMQMWRDKSMSKATKTVGSESFPSTDFLVVEDPDKPDSWHLQVKRHGKPDHGLMGAAYAALTVGFRGNKYEGPGKEEAMRKLRALYNAEDMEWPGGKSAVELPMLLTKADKMADGRIRWQARANTGEWDLERERFDGTFWDDVLHNFSKVQEAISRSEVVDLPVPILDIAHYSFRLPAAKRNMARAGYPIKLWQDGKALMAQGYFDDTPLGKAAAIAAQARPVEDRRVSIGVWPDWGRVELTEDGRRIYKGGRNRAYLDHLAMTGSPVDPGTILEVKSMTQKQDALDVLGEDAAALVNELEAATIGKTMPDGVLVKGPASEAGQSEECACAAPQPEQKAEGEGDAEVQPAAKADAAEAIDVLTEVDSKKPEKTLTMRELKELLSALFNTFGKSIDERMAPIEAALGKIEAVEARVNALAATETEKVKAAVDSPSGDWLTEMIRKSVQRHEPVKGAEPQAAVDTSDPFYKVFGGLKPK